MLPWELRTRSSPRSRPAARRTIPARNAPARQHGRTGPPFLSRPPGGDGPSPVQPCAPRWLST